MDDNSRSSKGLGITSILTLIFIVLKLVGVINWSWFWVLSPIIFEVILVLIIILLFVIFGG